MLSRGLAFFAPDIEVLRIPGLGLPAVRPRLAACRRRRAAHDHAGAARQHQGPRKPGHPAHHRQRRAAARAAARPARPAIALGRAGQYAADGGHHAWLELNGFNRASTVREPGDYAMRGGIVDLFAPGMEEPVRLDFFGDTLEFDPPLRSRNPAHHLRDARARSGADGGVSAHHRHHPAVPHRLCRRSSAPPAPDDALYEAVSEGRRYRRHGALAAAVPSALDTLFDYLDGTPIALEPLGRRSRARAARPDRRLLRSAQGRRSIRPAAARPTSRCRRTGSISPRANGANGSDKSALARLSPFAAPDGAREAIDIGARTGHNFAAERADARANVFDAVKKHVEALQTAGKRVMIALWSDGSRERMAHVLAEHGLLNLTPAASWPQALGAAARTQVALIVLGLEAGFETADVALITEQDILGERLVRPRRASKRAENFIAEVTSLSAGDLVVHVDHGIGRFVGLKPSKPPARRTIVSKSIITAATSSSCRSRTSNSCRATARKRRPSSSTASAPPPGSRARRG